jgi:lipopolysaccharide transport system permease protein
MSGHPVAARGSGAANPFAFLVLARRHRHLILSLAARRIEAQYRGSALGMLWAVLQPLLLLAVYTFAFAFVLGAHWSPDQAGKADFALFAFSGMLLFAVFSKPFSEAPHLIVANQSYIKQLVFPAEVLPWASVIAALFDYAVGFAIWAVLFIGMRGAPPATWILMPLVTLPAVLLALGASWLLSSLGVFLRDLSQVVSLAATALFFLSPIVYPASRIPEWLEPYYHANPLVGILEGSKGVLFHGTAPNWGHFGVLLLASWLVAWLGYAWFMRTKSSFADVL